MYLTDVHALSLCTIRDSVRSDITNNGRLCSRVTRCRKSSRHNSGNQYLTSGPISTGPHVIAYYVSVTIRYEHDERVLIVIS